MELTDEEELHELSPDFAALSELPWWYRHHAARMISAISSRFFAPVAGAQEDPVTGSAHCALAPYWRSNPKPT